MSDLDERGIEWDERTKGGTGGARYNCFGGNQVGQGGGNLGKIHQFVKLYYFSADLQNEIKSFDTAIDQYIAEVLQTLNNIKARQHVVPFSSISRDERDLPM